MQSIHERDLRQKGAGAAREERGQSEMRVIYGEGAESGRGGGFVARDGGNKLGKL